MKKEDMYQMWLLQGGRCEICKERLDYQTPKSFHVDHDTSCCPKEQMKNGSSCGGCVRSLLCGSCNQGLGNFKDSVYRLNEASKYLERTA